MTKSNFNKRWLNELHILHTNQDAHKSDLNLVICIASSSAGKESACTWETWVWSWVRKIPWRRERLFTPVFWPGEFHGLYCPRCRKESDMTEPLSLSLSFMLHPLNSTLTCGPFYLICCFHMRIWCLLKSSGPDLLLSSNNPLSYHSIYILPKNLWRLLNL